MAISGPRRCSLYRFLINELGTNAVKHGSLSIPDGQVAISWHIERDPQKPMFVMTWTESGGPLVGEPKTHGLGTRLIKAGIS